MFFEELFPQAKMQIHKRAPETPEAEVSKSLHIQLIWLSYMLMSLLLSIFQFSSDYPFLCHLYQNMAQEVSFILKTTF